MQSKNLCQECIKKSTCTRLCKEAEKYVGQDKVVFKDFERPLNDMDARDILISEESKFNIAWKSDVYLTETERQILTLLGKELSRSDVCEVLEITKHSLRQHIVNIKKKHKES